MRFSESRYALPGCAQITLWYSGAGSPSISIATAAAPDHEQFALVAGAAGTWVTSSCVPIASAAPITSDGTVQAQPGDVVFVFASTGSTAIAMGSFTIAGTPSITPAVSVRIDRTPLPASIATGPLGPNARLDGRNGDATFFALNAVLVSDQVPGDVATFVRRYHGTDLGSVSIPTSTTGGPPRVYHTVQIDPSTFDDTGFAGMLTLEHVKKGTIRVSSSKARRLLDLIMTEQVAGTPVWPDVLSLPQDAPQSDEGSGLSQFTNWWFAPYATDGSQAVNGGEAMALLDVMEPQSLSTSTIAVIDGGFGGPKDFGGNFTPPDYGAPANDYDQISQCSTDALGGMTCAPGVAQGPSPIACQGGSCPWHGLQMASIAAGRFNNGWGGMAGIGGQVSKLQLFKVGFSYTIPLARSIATAPATARILSISSGAPCVLAGIDLCDGLVRAGLIALCATVWLGNLPALAACAAIVVYATFDAVSTAVGFAIASNTVILAAAGNTQDEDPSAVKMFPCVLKNVTCVGGLSGVPSGTAPAPIRNTSLTKGARINIWAPGSRVPAMPDPDSGGLMSSIAGTSPATAFMAGVSAIALAIDPSLTGAQVRTLLSTSACRTGNTARLAGPACVPSADADVDGNGSGYVDVLEVVAEARAMAGKPSLGNCTGGFDELAAPTGDTPDTTHALPNFPAALSGVLGQFDNLDASLTELDPLAPSADTTFYSFSITGSIPNVKAINVRASMTVPDPTLGTLTLAFWQLSGNGIGPMQISSVPTSLSQDSSSGTAFVESALVIGKRYALQVSANSPLALNSNCFTSLKFEAEEGAADPPTHEPWLEVGNAALLAASSPQQPAGSATFVTIPITLTGPLPYPVPVDYTFTDTLQFDTALAGIDFIATPGTVTIPVGGTEATIVVPILNHSASSAFPKRFLINISSSAAPTLRSRGWTYIYSRVSGVAPTIEIGDVDVFEGDTTPGAGFNFAHLTVSADQPVSQDVTVTYNTVDGTGTSPTDYIATSGSVTIPAGQSSVDIAIAITPNTFPQFNKTFSVVLTGVTGASATLGPKATGTAFVIDDDPTP